MHRYRMTFSVSFCSRAFVILPVFLAITLFDYHFAADAAIESQTSQPVIVYGIQVNRRFSKKSQRNNNSNLLNSSSIDHNWLPDGLFSNDPKVNNVLNITNTPSNPPNDPTPIITKQKYIGNVNLYDDKDYHQEFDNKNDQQSKYSINNENTVNKFNRHVRRQSENYRPIAVTEAADLASTDDGHEYSVYENGHGGPDENADGWYGAPPVYDARPVHARPDVRYPGHHGHHGVTAADADHWIASTAVNVGAVKAKALKALKFLLLVAIELKTFVLVKLFLLVKLMAAAKTLRQFLPHVHENAKPTAQPDNTTAACPKPPKSDGGVTGTEDGGTRQHDAGVVRGSVAVARFAASVLRSAECVERTACRAAGSPSLRSVLLAGIMSYSTNFISYEKLKLFTSTFKNVMDTRLEKKLGNFTSEEWFKWCNERYLCEEYPSKNNII